MILKSISDRIYYLLPDEYYDRPTLGYIRGDRYSVMIDCGSSKRHMALFNKGLQERGLPLPRFAIITHWHWDHTFGMGAFGGSTIANSLTDTKLQKVQTWRWTDEAMKARLKKGEDIEMCDTCIRREYPKIGEIKVKTADIVFEERLSLDLGDIHCEAQRVGGTHGEDSNIIYVPEEKVLFVGDADCSNLYEGDGNYDRGKLTQYIETLRGIDFQFYIHGHCEVMDKEEILAELEEELQGLK